MRQTLRLHPYSRCLSVAHVEVEVTRLEAHNLMFAYVVTGQISDLLMPPVAAASRTDELWRHTCFEAFVRGLGSAYYEFNFAPSTQWAAYQFGGYRSGMRVATEIKTPRIAVESSSERFILQTSLDLNQLSIITPGGGGTTGGPTIRSLGLSAVIEETNGRRSYWALAHPPGKADFHHLDGFAFEIG